MRPRIQKNPAIPGGAFLFSPLQTFLVPYAAHKASRLNFRIGHVIPANRNLDGYEIRLLQGIVDILISRIEHPVPSCGISGSGLEGYLGSIGMEIGFQVIPIQRNEVEIQPIVEHSRQAFRKSLVPISPPIFIEQIVGILVHIIKQGFPLYAIRHMPAIGADSLMERID